MPAKKVFPEGALQNIMELRAQGAPLSDIAQHYKCSIPTITHFLKMHGAVLSTRRAGFNVAKGRFLSDAEKSHILTLYKEGKSIQAISSTLGVSRSSVRTVLSLAGVPLRVYTAARRDACTAPSGEILCKTCETWKKPEQFFISQSASNGRTSSCKACMVQANRTRAMGITADQYQALQAQQQGRCAICGADPAHRRNRRKTSLSADHDHATGKIRGLLCVACNHALGLMADNVELLKKAILYLEQQHAP